MKTYLTRTVVSVLSAVIAVCLSVQTHAQILTFEFSGTLSEVNAADSLTAGFGSVGDPFWGNLSFDPTWQNSVGSAFVNLKNQGWYPYYPDDPAEQAITMSFNTAAKSTQLLISTLDGSYLIAGGTPGNYTFECQGNWVGGGEGLMEFVLGNTTGAGISGTSVPSNLDLNDWTVHYVALQGNAGAAGLQANITSIQMVPEPGAKLMTELGFITLSSLSGLKIRQEIC
jgi:hypothetical protein